MTPCDTPTQGEIWLVHFRFYEIDGAKNRPAICIDWDEDNHEGIFCKVTKRNRTAQDDGDVLLAEWPYDGLLMESTARCSQLQVIPQSALHRRLGTLTDGDYYRVFSKLSAKHPTLFM